MNTSQDTRIEALQTLKDLADTPVLTVEDIERMFEDRK